MKNIRKRLNKQIEPKKISFYIFILAMMAHAYVFFDFYASHDSLMIVTNDKSWQISLGRFAEPIYTSFIRGSINAPWLIGILSFGFLGFSLFLIFSLLQFKYWETIIIISGIFFTNITLISLYATYMSFVDIYMLAFLCACSGVYVLTKYKRGIYVSIFLFAISMGLYQSFISCAIALMILVIIKKTLEEKSFGFLYKMGFKYVFSLIGSALLYIALVKLSLLIFGISLSDTYNGLATLLKSDIISILKVIPGAYKHFFSFFWTVTGYNTKIMCSFNICLFIWGILSWITYLYKKQMNHFYWIFIGLAILIFPLGMDFVFIMAGGWANVLMIFGFYFVYILIFMPYEYMKQEEKINLQSIAVLICFFMIFHNIIYSNGAYYYKNIVGKKTDFYMVSLISEMDRYPNYIAGETPVIVIGEFGDSYIAKPHIGFERYRDLIGTTPVSITYPLSFSSYCRDILGHPINLIWSEDEINQFSVLDEVIDMPSFPLDGFCKIINGVMVIKL